MIDWAELLTDFVYATTVLGATYLYMQHVVMRYPPWKCTCDDCTGPVDSKRAIIIAEVPEPNHHGPEPEAEDDVTVAEAAD